MIDKMPALPWTRPFFAPYLPPASGGDRRILYAGSRVHRPSPPACGGRKGGSFLGLRVKLVFDEKTGPATGSS